MATAASRIFRSRKWRPNLRDWSDANVTKPRLLRDTGGNSFRNPLPGVGIGHSRIFLAVGQIGTFAKHATNIRIPS
jgi:hypothetical protein